MEESEILKQWMKLFNLRSFCNEIPGQILFHVVIGQKLKDLRIITKPGKYVDYRIHFGHLQDSGSGKGEGLEFTLDIIKCLNPKLKIEQLGGSTTDSSLLNSNNKNGILQEANFVYYPEARTLFDPSKWSSEIREILIAVMEPIGSNGNAYSKRLGKYDFTISTKSSASLTFTTRPIMNVRGDIPTVGHLQRAIFYPRELSKSLRKEMNRKNIEIFEKSESIDFVQNKQNLVKNIEKICEAGIKNPPQIQDINEFTKELTLKMEKFNEKINGIPDREDTQILNSFLSRYTDYMLILSHHSAIMRKSKVVEIEDLDYAFDLMWKVFEQLCLWVELTIEKDWRFESDREKKLKQIKSWIEQAGGKQGLNELATQYARKYSKSVMAGRLFIEEHKEESGFEIQKPEGKPAIVLWKE